MLAGMDMGSALTHEDVAREHELPIRALDAQTLGFGITAVFGGADALLVSEQLQIYFQHEITPPSIRS